MSDEGTVLIVDDFEDNRTMYAEFLKFSGYDVVEASDGLEAIDKATSFPPDVVVMDLSLLAPRRMGGHPTAESGIPGRSTSPSSFSAATSWKDIGKAPAMPGATASWPNRACPRRCSRPYVRCSREFAFCRASPTARGLSRVTSPGTGLRRRAKRVSRDPTVARRLGERGR